jgi:hypothetical protein
MSAQSVEPVPNLSVDLLHPDPAQGHGTPLEQEKENISILVETSPTRDKEKKGSSGSRPSSPHSCTSGRVGATNGAAGGGEALRPLGQLPSVQSFDGIPIPAEAIHAKMTELGGKRWADMTDDESPVIPSPSDLRSPCKRAPSISVKQSSDLPDGTSASTHQDPAGKEASDTAGYHTQAQEEEHLEGTDGEEGAKEDDEWTPPTREQSTVHEDFPATPPVGKPAPPPAAGPSGSSVPAPAGVHKPSPRNRNLNPHSGSTSAESSPELRPKPATAPRSVGEEEKPETVPGPLALPGASYSVSPGVYPKVPYSTPKTSPGLNPSFRSPPSALVAPTPLGDDCDSGFMLPPSALPLPTPATQVGHQQGQNPNPRPSWQNRTPPSHPQRSPQSVPAPTSQEGLGGKGPQQGSGPSSSHTTPKWRPSPSTKATPPPSPNLSLVSRTSPPPAQPSWLSSAYQTVTSRKEQESRSVADPSELTVHVRTIPTRNHPGTVSPNVQPVSAPLQAEDPNQTWNNTTIPVPASTIAPGSGYRTATLSPPPASTAQQEGVVNSRGQPKTTTHNDPYASHTVPMPTETYLMMDPPPRIEPTAAFSLASQMRTSGPGAGMGMSQPMVTHGSVNPISGRPMRHHRGGGFGAYRRQAEGRTTFDASVPLNPEQLVETLIARSVHGTALRHRLSFHPYNGEYWQVVLPTAHSHAPSGSNGPSATVPHPKGADFGPTPSAATQQLPSSHQGELQAEALPIVRLFVGHWWKQLPYSILQWLVETFVPPLTYNSHCVMFNPQPHCDKQNRFKGCLHVNLCTSNPKAVVDTLHHRVLFDVEGAWFASNPEERRFLEEYCASIRATPESCRFGQLRTLPPNPIAFEFAKNL